MTTPNKNNNSNNRNFPPLPTPNRLNRSHSQATPSRRTPGGTRLLPPQRTVPTPSNTSSNSNGNNNNHGTPRSFLRQLTKAPGMPRPTPPPENEEPATLNQSLSRSQTTPNTNADTSHTKFFQSSNKKQDDTNQSPFFSVIPPTVRRSSAFKGISRPSMPPPPTPSNNANDESLHQETPGSIVSIDSPISISEYWRQHRPVSASPSNVSSFDETENPEIARRERIVDPRISIGNRSSFGFNLGNESVGDGFDQQSEIINDPSIHLYNESLRRQSIPQNNASTVLDTSVRNDRTIDGFGNESISIGQPDIILNEDDAYNSPQPSASSGKDQSASPVYNNADISEKGRNFNDVPNEDEDEDNNLDIEVGDIDQNDIEIDNEGVNQDNVDMNLIDDEVDIMNDEEAIDEDIDNQLNHNLDNTNSDGWNLQTDQDDQNDQNEEVEEDVDNVDNNRNLSNEAVVNDENHNNSNNNNNNNISGQMQDRAQENTVTETNEPPKKKQRKAQNKPKERISKNGVTLPSINAPNLKRHFERFLNQNRVGRKIMIEKDTTETLMDKCHEFMELFMNQTELVANQHGRGRDLKEIDMISVMEQQGILTSRIPLQSLARKLLPGEFIHEYDDMAGDWGEDYVNSSKKNRKK